VDLAESHVGERHQAGDPDGELVGRLVGLGRESPVRDQLVAVEDANVALRVPYVDRQQHSVPIIRIWIRVGSRRGAAQLVAVYTMLAIVFGFA
jgi:hypothetical protein